MGGEHLSPSGEYKLVVNSHATKPGCWDYTRGLVYRKGSDKPIAKVKRNYSSFPFCWIDHPNGHSYLVCGEDYQGQTVIELDTGKRRDHLPPEAEKGHGFCWADYRFDAATLMLVVEGCIWACPYEFRFYDFSDPMNGWPEIEPTEKCEPIGIYADGKPPVIEPDGTIKSYDTTNNDSDDDDIKVDFNARTEDDRVRLNTVCSKASLVDWPQEPGNSVIVSDGEVRASAVIEFLDGELVAKVDWTTARDVANAIKTFRREGLKLILVDEWVSEAEKVRRIEREEGERRYSKWLADFRAGDPLYLAYAARLKDKVLKPADYESIGITHERWCPDFTGNERRMCRRIIDRGREKNGYTIDLEWAVDTGPVKLSIYKDGNTDHDKFFEHSVAGMNQAFDYAEKLLGDGS